MSYNLQAITRAWVAKLADAQDSGSCEQYAHVGSSPVPRTTKPRYSIGCAGVLFFIAYSFEAGLERAEKATIHKNCCPAPA